MAATSHVVHSLELPLADVMDLHSDSGLDFADGDGDIELDLEPAPVPHTGDDDVSINDAVSVSGQDLQTVPDEQDDFMVDHEDLIEEDYMFPEDDGVVVTQQPTAIVSHVQALAPPDEDLIDYSDDEGQPLPDDYTAPHQQVQDDPHGKQVEHTREQQDDTRLEDATNRDGVEHVDVASHGQTQELVSNVVEATTHDRSSAPSDHQSASHEEDDDHTDSEQGGVALQDHVSVGDDTEGAHAAYDDVTQHDHEQAYSSANDNPSEEAPALQPVTVNYAGNELWLFREHDTDDSGDWLLEDISLAKSRISDVFQACRLSLGDDVSNEHEIGFRFDHLHALELYEDNTACVAVSLQRLVDLYHTLQAQDGNNEPESFYISLLFRPRFVTLLSDVAKFAEDGSGYSALHAAVSAGDTHFTNVLSASSSEEATEWDNDEQEDTDNEGEEETLAHSEVQQDDDQSGHGSLHESTYETQDDMLHAGGDGHLDEETQLDDGSPVQQDGVDLNDPPTQESAHGNSTSSNDEHVTTHLDDGVVQSQLEISSESDARRAQKEDDLINYSDDEGADPTEEVESAPAPAPEPLNGSSPSSSTVQGDEPTNVIAGTHTVGSPPPDTEQQETHDRSSSQPREQHQVDGTATQSYQDLVEAYDVDDSFQGFPADGEEEFSLDPQYGDHANQDYAGFEYQPSDQPLHLDFMDGAEFNEADHKASHDFTEQDDILDLDNAPEWATDKVPISTVPENVLIIHDDVGTVEYDEAGVAEHPAAAVTSDATAEAVSSSEIKHMSPQGQKRSIDEAGHGADDALDSIGMFAWLLSWEAAPSTNGFSLDTKRPRV